MTDAKVPGPNDRPPASRAGAGPVLAGWGRPWCCWRTCWWARQAGIGRQTPTSRRCWATSSGRSACPVLWARGPWALLGLAGAIAQRPVPQPLAEPHLLGSSAGASVGVALSLAAAQGFGLNWVLGGALAWWAQASVALAAMLGSLMAMALTLSLARGAVQTTRLLLAGIVVSVVLGAATSWITLMGPRTCCAAARIHDGTDWPDRLVV